jgi:hypothetical protein
MLGWRWLLAMSDDLFALLFPGAARMLGWRWLLERVGLTAPKGTIVTKYIRCSKPGCHCANPGDPGHGPYRYRTWREAGQVRTQYLGKADVNQQS